MYFVEDFRDIPSTAKPPSSKPKHLLYIDYINYQLQCDSVCCCTENNNVHTCFAIEDEVQALNMQYINNGSATNPCGNSPCIHKNELKCIYA